MRIKSRTTPIIVLSSLIIISVLLLTMFGFYVYLEWKNKNALRNYNLAIYDLNGQLYKKNILINLEAKIGKKGMLKGRPVIAGTIKNNSNKRIYSLKLKVYFSDETQRVLCVNTFYPVGSEFEPFVNLPDVRKNTKNFLAESDSISFTHQLGNCPPRVLNYLKSHLKFAKPGKGKEKLQFTYKIEGLDLE